MKSTAINLYPARWVWWPGERTLPNTFILFRRELVLRTLPLRALGWISADSRYRLTINGHRVQWGPPPCDPRFLEADPLDLATYFVAGTNVIGIEVLFYGAGDGTWAMGKPGMIFHLQIEGADGETQTLVSDDGWQCFLDRAHRPGQHKRWFLRALQEEFDARLHPHGWSTPDYVPDARWLPAMMLDCPADKPAFWTRGFDSLTATQALEGELRRREIPLLEETWVPALRLAEQYRVVWHRDPLDWFDCRTPGSFELQREEIATKEEQDWQLPTALQGQGQALTFEWSEQIVGWPSFEIEAPEGTIIEMMTQESHDANITGWLDTHHFSWTRFICREGWNRFEAFDFDSLRWVQLHVRNNARPVAIRNVQVLRRQFPWPCQPQIHCDEPALNLLFEAALNTLHNSAQETCVDGMGRERQQYSGDGGHQLQAIRSAFGETRLPARFITTFSQGLALDGYFLDCWPAYDRLARVMQRQVGATEWGPLLDHGVGFVFDCWQHFLETGHLNDVREAYPRLLRFAAYLQGLVGTDGLLPVENIGVPTVWLDHHAYQKQHHKQCAFNLYAAAMLSHALAPLCVAFGNNADAAHWESAGRSLLQRTTEVFWDAEKQLFVANRPWLADESGRLCDRSLATAILFDQCPQAATSAAIEALVQCPPEMGFSYPCNAGWRLRALCKAGRPDAVLGDLRTRWATMDSVICNNTLQEEWHAKPDSGQQWSHCPVAPLYVLFHDIAGLRATTPGYETMDIDPKLGDLQSLELTLHSVRGPIRMSARSQNNGHHVMVALPPGCRGVWRGDTSTPWTGESSCFFPASQ